MKQLEIKPEATATRGAFWDDLAKDLEDPDFLREYVVESVRIATIDAVVSRLDEARDAAGLSKAGLARAIGVEPAVIRRLFANGHVNPTLGTLAEVAAALGMRVALEPLPEAERAQVTEPLLQGCSAQPKVLASYLSEMRRGRRTRPSVVVG
jgi:transcriptional regulator with XRE-family HTH domain